MALSCLIVAGITITSLYQAAISEGRERLVETAQSQARLIEAHEPVAELDLGIVAKIDLSEIRAPFLKAGAIAGLFSVLVVLAGASLFIKITNPMIKQLETRAVEFETMTDEMKREIKRRKLAEEKLKKSERRLKAAQKVAKVANYERDFITGEGFWSDEQYRLFGYKPGKVQHSHELFKKHLHPEDRERIEKIIETSLSTGESFGTDCRYIPKDGDSRHAHIICNVQIDDEGKPRWLRGTFQDITERKRAEEELAKLNLQLEDRVKQRTAQLQKEVIERKQAEEKLRNNKEMLQMVFDGISDPLVMLGKNLEIMLLNKAASAYYHVGQKEVIGKPCHQALRGRSAPCEDCEIPSAILNHSYEMFERKGFMDSNKTEKVVIYPIGDWRGELDSVIMRITDITQEKILQRRMVQTEKLLSLGFLVSGVAHEINNPNNFITFNIPILKDYLNEILPIIDEYAKKHENLELCCMPYPEFRNDIFKLVKNIENGSRRIQAAVSNLRGITRVKDKLQMDMIDIQEVIEKSVSICRAKIDRLVESFEVDIPKDLPRIYADPETLELVIINLLINAAQAADKDNSWIRLHVSLGDSRQNHLIIEVRDNGCGMDQKTQNHIFEPFFTTKSPGEGTGLGLTLCLNSIKELGGQIEVDSIQGKGSTFKVILPDKGNRHTKR
jgi:PAS domain S-box-containing protein